jgi:hypothetical protein
MREITPEGIHPGRGRADEAVPIRSETQLLIISNGPVKSVFGNHRPRFVPHLGDAPNPIPVGVEFVSECRRVFVRALGIVMSGFDHVTFVVVNPGIFTSH